MSTWDQNDTAQPRHCRTCGTVVERRVPDGDNRLRDVCPVCGAIHYDNPLNVVGTLPWRRNGQGEVEVLLCLRNIEPQLGFWTLPAGFMENEESVAEGALRETQEEAGADIVLGELLLLCTVRRANQVHFFYTAELQSDRFDPGEETQAVGLYTRESLPWGRIAFASVKLALEVFFSQINDGGFHLHCADIPS
ncbi:NUDIX hydrolase [Amphibiibacter pelophylacis]|uniref:NUDIX hydrolase n=1 Tax=Amphibiibacter pelophylacis TaxID=1799477 RepID=A0ACC6P308_9BURK